MSTPSGTLDLHSGSFRRLQVNSLSVDQTLRVDVWSPTGQLLLAKGQRIATAEQLEHLADREPMVKTGRTHATDEGSVAVSARPADLNPLTACPQLHARLTRLLHLDVQTGDFAERLDSIASTARELLAGHRDKSLFLFMQMLFDVSRGYCASHALLCAAVCQVIGEATALPETARQSLFKAALTMNIGMSTLQDELARQNQPLDDNQRNAIAEHAAASTERLQQLGVTDPQWLQLVEAHHQTDKQDSTAAQILHMVDVYVARLSPRRTRQSLRPQQAARETYVQSQAQDGSLGILLVKALGVYPIGSYVRLESGEIAVVTGQGKQANHPLTFALRGRNGLTFSSPLPRDTADARYVVRESLVADDVSIRLSAARLFRQT